MAPTFYPGQRVWLAMKDLPLWVESKKLATHYIGPFKIVKRVSPVAYHVELPRSMKINPTFHVSSLKLVLCSHLAVSPKPTPPL